MKAPKEVKLESRMEKPSTCGKVLVSNFQRCLFSFPKRGEDESNFTNVIGLESPTSGPGLIEKEWKCFIFKQWQQ